MSTLRYRPEIDGLRAVAVIPVVLYHLSPGLVPGGFMGVDVFFVISGFLITSIILREHESESFTLRAFWMRRIRRLFPALAALLFATVVAGYFILYDAEWQSLGAQLTAVLFLAANLYMRKETGDYWGSAAEDIPLLHTWSLAVEEQFYLGFPLLVLLLLRIGPRFLLPTLALGAIASLAHCIVRTGSDPTSAFYLLPARAWELLLGCLLATRQQNSAKPLSEMRLSQFLALLGLAMVVGSYFVVRSSAGFPGYKALLPTVGTLLVLAFAGAKDGFTRTFLSTAPMVFVGRISYSLYLWHWPIIVYWRLYTMKDPAAPGNAVLLFIASFAAATLSYYFVEATFRRPSFPIRSPKGAVIAASFTLLFAFSFLLSGAHLRPTTRQSIGAAPFSGQHYNAEQEDAWRTGGIVIGTAPPQIVVIGSSHALMYGATIAGIAREQDVGVSFLCVGNVFGRFHTAGDTAIFRDGLADRRTEFDRARLNHLQQWKPPHVLWIGRWDNQQEILGAGEFDRIVRLSLTILLENAGEVTLVTQAPFSMERPGSVVRFANTLRRNEAPLRGREDLERAAHRSSANAALRQIAANLPRVGIVETSDLFELGEGGVRILSEDGRLLYHDDNHLSDLGAELVRERIARVLAAPISGGGGSQPAPESQVQEKP